MGVGGVVVCGPLHIGRRGARAEDGHPVDAARSVPTPPGTGMGRRLSAIPRCARLGGESAESARPEARLRSEMRLPPEARSPGGGNRPGNRPWRFVRLGGGDLMYGEGLVGRAWPQASY